MADGPDLGGSWDPVPADQRWGGDGQPRLGPDPVPDVYQAYTPIADRLPLEARSVRVPAVMSLVLAVLAVVSFGALVVVVAGAVGRAAVLDDLENLDREYSRSQVARCQERRSDLEDARDDYVDRTGRTPTDIDQLDVGARDYVLDDDGHPVPTPGGPCEGIQRGDDGVSRDVAIADRAYLAWTEVVASVAFALFVLGVLSWLAAPGMLSFWLARAYRSLPKVTQHVPYRRAYSYLRTVAVVIPLWVAADIAIMRYMAPESATAASWMLYLAAVIVTVLLARAALRMVSMIGDVTFEFCGRHYGTSRGMKAAVVAWTVAPVLTRVILEIANLTTPSGLALDAVLIGLLILTVVTALAPLVFLVCLVVAMALATSGIERRLVEAAQELTTAEEHENVVRSVTTPASLRPPVGV